ncbi:MAG: HDOD domain-containing protein [Polyangiaceae bacterium]
MSESVAVQEAVATAQPTPMTDLERELLRRLETGRTALPVLPQVATMAVKLAGDPAANVEELAKLVDTDPPIAARFLSVANSAAYWRGFNTSNTQAAIVRLGLARTRDLLFQVVYANTTRGLKRYQSQVRASFERSVRCAVASRVVASTLGLPQEMDYMCGLLHDIGESRLYRILDSMSPQPKNRAEVERLVQAYHCRAGAEVAMAWRLPAEIVDACAAHHDPEAAASSHVRMVMLADVVIDALTAPQRARFEALGVDEGTELMLMENFRREERSSVRAAVVRT